jgi:hypothetical protein
MWTSLGPMRTIGPKNSISQVQQDNFVLDYHISRAILASWTRVFRAHTMSPTRTRTVVR